MAGSISNAYETNILTWTLTATAVTRPTVWYVGLFTDATGTSTDQPATEATTGTCPGYARQSVTWTVSGATAQNSNAPTFTASGAWATVNYFGIYDASSSGNLIAWGSITGKTLANADQLKFDINQITITLD